MGSGHARDDDLADVLLEDVLVVGVRRDPDEDRLEEVQDHLFRITHYVRIFFIDYSEFRTRI